MKDYKKIKKIIEETSNHRLDYFINNVDFLADTFHGISNALESSGFIEEANNFFKIYNQMSEIVHFIINIKQNAKK